MSTKVCKDICANATVLVGASDKVVSPDQVLRT